MPDIIGRVVKEYGPIAFGVVALLLLWKTIVGPELAASRAYIGQITSAASDMRETAAAQNDLANSLNDTARVLSQTAALLDRTSERLDRVRGE